MLSQLYVKIISNNFSIGGHQMNPGDDDEEKTDIFFHSPTLYGAVKKVFCDKSEELIKQFTEAFVDFIISSTAMEN